MTNVLSFDGLRRLFAQTVRDPQGTAHLLMELRVPQRALWIGLALVSVIAVFVLRLSLLPLDQSALTEAGQIMVHPIWGTAVQAVSMVLLVTVITYGGRAFGGVGRFDDALLLFLWLQFFVAVLGLVQTLLFLLFPLAGVAASIVTSVLFLWLLTQFVAALHGFTRTGLVFLGMIGGLFVLIVALSLLLVLLGITPPQGVV